MAWFERVNPTEVSRDPETTADIAAPSKRGAIHSENRSLPAGRTPRRVICAVRICGGSPYRVRALKREKSLWYVGLHERYTACLSDKFDELNVNNTSDPLVSGYGKHVLDAKQRTSESH